MLTLSVSATNQQPGQQPPQVQQPAQVQRFTMQQRQAWGQWQNRNRQQNQPQPNRSGQFSPAEYWKQQKEFFTQRAGLTEEEANAFFNGDITAEEAARRIQNRVEIYLAERG